MNKHLLTPLKYSLIIVALVSTTALGMETDKEGAKQSSPQTSHIPKEEPMDPTRTLVRESIEKEWGQHYLKEADEDYQQHFKTYHERAFSAVQTWAGADPNRLIALGNFKSIKNQYPIPAENTWAVRGWIKKYNLALLEIVNKSIAEQKLKYRQDKLDELEKDMLG